MRLEHKERNACVRRQELFYSKAKADAFMRRYAVVSRLNIPKPERRKNTVRRLLNAPSVAEESCKKFALAELKSAIGSMKPKGAPAETESLHDSSVLSVLRRSTSCCPSTMTLGPSALALHIGEHSRPDPLHGRFLHCWISVRHSTPYGATACMRSFSRKACRGWSDGSMASCRRARVRLDGVNGSGTKLQQGVPQGSVLSPLLFLFYINGIRDAAPDGTFISMYADDIAVWSQYKDRA